MAHILLCEAGEFGPGGLAGLNAVLATHPDECYIMTARQRRVCVADLAREAAYPVLIGRLECKLQWDHDAGHWEAAE